MFIFIRDLVTIRVVPSRLGRVGLSWVSAIIFGGIGGYSSHSYRRRAYRESPNLERYYVPMLGEYANSWVLEEE
jgi:hypothetical protein